MWILPGRLHCIIPQQEGYVISQDMCPAALCTFAKLYCILCHAGARMVLADGYRDG